MAYKEYIFMHSSQEVNNTVVLLLYRTFSVLMHVEIPEHISGSNRSSKT